MEKERHYCTYCKKKVYAEKMQKIYYRLLHKQAWHCNECIKKLNSDFIADSAIVYLSGQTKEKNK